MIILDKFHCIYVLIFVKLRVFSNFFIEKNGSIFFIVSSFISSNPFPFADKLLLPVVYGLKRKRHSIKERISEISRHVIDKIAYQNLPPSVVQVKIPKEMSYYSKPRKLF